MPQITRKLEFDYGHRVLGHEGKCASLHGHRGVAEITIEAPELDHLGRVVDFGVVKERVGQWIDRNWDHNMLLHPDDPLLQATIIKDGKMSPVAIWGMKKPFIFPAGVNPTAENIATHLFNVAQTLLETHSIHVIRVRIWETPNCCADHFLS